MTVSLLLFGEILPKAIGRIYPEEVVSRLAPLVKFFLLLFKPFAWIFQKSRMLIHRVFPLPLEAKLSEEELLLLVDEAHLSGSIESEEHQLVKAAIEFDDREIASSLTPRSDVIGFELKDSLAEIEQLYLTSPYSRLLVYQESLDDIIGTMHGKDFFRYLKNESNQLKPIEDFITKPLFVPATISHSDLLNAMQREHTHIGIIVDEYGRMIGIATMEDILEELVGEIWDESDVIRSEFKQLSGDDRYLIEGTYSLNKLFELFEMTHEEEWLSNTVSGFIMEQFEHIPENNEIIYYKNLKITVVNAQKQRVNEVIIQKLSDDEMKKINLR